MVLKYISAIALILSGCVLYAQAPDVEWTRVFTYDSLPSKAGDQTDIRSHYVIETRDKGFIMTGHCCCTHCMGDMIVIRTDSAGKILWKQRYDDNTMNEIGNCITEVDNGGFIIAALSMDPGSNLADMFMVRIDAAGDTLWTRTIGLAGNGNLEVPYSVQETHDSGFVVAGYKEPSGSAQHSQVYLVRLNQSGDTLWTKQFGGTMNDEARCVQETKDRGFVVCGFTRSFGAGGSDVYLVRTDSAGNSLWAKTFGTGMHDGGYYVEETRDSGFIIAGYTSDYQKAYLVRADKNGDLIWEKALGSDTTSACGMSVHELPEGGYVVAGHTGQNHASGFITRTDAQGNAVWTKVFEDGSPNYISSMGLTSDNGLISTGRAGAGAPSTEAEMRLIKLPSR